MKIVVKAEKAGQVIAQSDFEVKKEGNLLKRARKAFAKFRQDYPDLPLFDDDVKIKFDKAE
jgi:hypothetical protein